MRLSSTEQQAIRTAAAECFGPDATVRLFGSRARPDGRGGDIDLLIETHQSDPNLVSHAHTRFLALLYGRLGEQKIDVLVDYPGRRFHPPVYAVARQEGVML
jgi:predicted nucleotidyltransferase